MEPTFPVHVGACVYCGSKQGLSDEHVIPYGLNGEWKLLAASCAVHRDVTSGFEGEVQRGAFMVPRASMGLKTRRKTERPTLLPVTLSRAGTREVVNLPVEEHPAFFAFPIFQDPGADSGDAARGIGVRTFVLASHLKLSERFRKQARVDTIGAPFPDLIAFARMLAKIGYCFSVACLGYDAVANAAILPAILGADRRLGDWVGCIEEAPRTPKGPFHGVVLLGSDTELRAHVRLFAQIGAPEYVVRLR